MSRPVVPVPEAQHYLGGVSRQTIYRLAREEQLRIIKIGRRSVIAVADLDAVLGLDNLDSQ